MRQDDVGCAALQTVLRCLHQRKARQKAKLNYEKKKAQQQGVISAMQAKKPDKTAAPKPHIKSIEQCVREAAALGISYGQYVQRGYDKVVLSTIKQKERKRKNGRS